MTFWLDFVNPVTYSEHFMNSDLIILLNETAYADIIQGGELQLNNKLIAKLNYNYLLKLQ